jgi:hypothetical protein
VAGIRADGPAVLRVRKAAAAGSEWGMAFAVSPQAPESGPASVQSASAMAPALSSEPQSERIWALLERVPMAAWLATVGPKEHRAALGWGPPASAADPAVSLILVVLLRVESP